MKTNEFDDFLASKLSGFEPQIPAPQYNGIIPTKPFYKRLPFFLLTFGLAVGVGAFFFFRVDPNSAASFQSNEQANVQPTISLKPTNSSTSDYSENTAIEISESAFNSTVEQTQTFKNSTYAANTNSTQTKKSKTVQKESKRTINNPPETQNIESYIYNNAAQLEEVPSFNENRIDLDFLALKDIHFEWNPTIIPPLSLKAIFCKTQDFKRNYIQAFSGYRFFQDLQTDSLAANFNSFEFGIQLQRELLPNFGYYIGLEVEQFHSNQQFALITATNETIEYTQNTNIQYDTTQVNQTVYNYYFGVPFANQQTIQVVDSTINFITDSVLIQQIDTLQKAALVKQSHQIVSIPLGVYKTMRINSAFAVTASVGALLGSTRKINTETLKKQQIVLLQPTTDLGVQIRLNRFLSTNLSANYKLQLNNNLLGRSNRNLGIRAQLIYNF